MAGKKKKKNKPANLGPKLPVWVDEDGKLYRPDLELKQLVPIEGKTVIELAAEYYLEATVIKADGKTLYYASKLPKDDGPLSIYQF